MSTSPSIQKPKSRAELIASLPKWERDEFLESLKTEEQRLAFLYGWREFWARPEQIAPPGDWRVWLILAGRGFGKTRTGAEWIIERERQGGKHMALIGETAADVRDVMIEGEAGIMKCAPPDRMPLYEPSKRRLSWPSGAVATAYSGDTPDVLRGPSHDTVWADEPAKWRYGQDAWDNMEFGLRIGDNPQVVATTTPRPIKLIRDLVADPKTHVTRGNTYENKYNLSADFIDRVVKKYEGTRLGRQELHAELLDDVPGALWTRKTIEQTRVKHIPDLTRIVVAIDPAMTSSDDADETGIVVCGRDKAGHGYVLGDYSLRGTPDQWGKIAIKAYNDHKADRIVAEVNNGGEMVEYTLRTIKASVAYKSVHASRGKRMRAEPISALYEQGRCHHVGMFERMEDQMCSYVPGQTDESPDRLDALVWAFTELLLDAAPIKRKKMTGF